MKEFNLSNFLGCCVIGICIIISGWLISKELPETVDFPASLAVTTSETGYGQYGDYLSIYEVSAYLRANEQDVRELLEQGEFIGVYTKINDSYVFSKEALKVWADSRIND